MVSISNMGSMGPDMTAKLVAGNAQTDMKIAAANPEIPALQAQIAKAKSDANTASSSGPAVSTGQPLVGPQTNLALYNDSESGMQVAVVRERVSGQLVEQIPTERARKIAALMRHQEQLAQELHNAETTARLNIET